jgi:hypothetical protein
MLNAGNGYLLHGKKIKGIAYVDDNSPIETSKEDMEHVLNEMNRAVVDLGMKNNVNKMEVYSQCIRQYHWNYW